jgi:hypothetical protein
VRAAKPARSQNKSTASHLYPTDLMLKCGHDTPQSQNTKQEEHIDDAAMP